MKIKKVLKNSIADKEGFKKGDVLLKINGKKVNDIIDFKYLTAEEIVRIEIDRYGEIFATTIRKDTDENIGLVFENNSNWRKCNNRCIFCFIDQNPPGLRKSLYFKDEDYRLSFLYGNYITMTNLSEKDIKRIIKFRLSPLYVSIHSTDKKIRRKMLGRNQEDYLLYKIKTLTNNGIVMHGQIVLCPGINDGPFLKKSVYELFKFFPLLRTVAVVPVGLTKYRKRLPKINPVTEKIAREIVEKISLWQKDFIEKTGESFVYLSDEFYLLSGHSLPEHKSYGEFWQIENGVGMVRSILNDFNSEKNNFPEKLLKKKKILFITGKLFSPVLAENIVCQLNKIDNLEVKLAEIENNFYGDSVTVAGLLCGRDILNTLRKQNDKFDLIVLPPDCVNEDRLFLDDISLSSINKEYDEKIFVFRNSFLEIFNRLK